MKESAAMFALPEMEDASFYEEAPDVVTQWAEKYLEKLDGELNAATMAQLNGEQLTLLAYYLLRTELLEGGFIQLIQNGLGPFIFHNPFAKAMRLWGVKELAKLVYDARRVYDENEALLTRPRSEEEFMALYEEFPDFDDLDDAFVEHEPEFSEAVGAYVEAHSTLFELT